MDATARFLAPKGGKAQVAPPRQEKPKQEQRRPDRRGEQQKPFKGSQKPAPESGKKQEKPTRPKDSRWRKEAPAAKAQPRKEPSSPRQEKPVQRRDSRPARPRGPVEAPHSGAQKDSTEQRSLMKPYYFNPDED